ncbi:MAG: hypothetical protein LRY69_02200 [Gammaproteobacteria bacterium]|nr:hypothetical protein [Gammaproteobacteria bacterium]
MNSNPYQPLRDPEEGNSQDPNRLTDVTMGSSEKQPSTHAELLTSSMVSLPTQVVIYALVSYVIPTTLTELLTPKKSIASLIVLAMTTPIAMEFFKICANTSTLLHHDFPVYFLGTVLQIGVLLLIAGVFYASHLGKEWTALGWNASITVPGIILKLLNECVLAPRFEEVSDEQSPIKRYFFPHTAYSPKDDWYNLPAVFHLARYTVLVSALIAGSELFEAIKIGSNSSVGDELVRLFHDCSATSSAAVNAGALLLNEIIGMSLFLGTGWFKDMYPSYASRLLTLIVMTALFQWLSTMIPLLKSETLGILFLSASITFFS